MGMLTKFKKKKPKEPSFFDEMVKEMVLSPFRPIAERAELGKEYSIEIKSLRCRRCGKLMPKFDIGDHMEKEGHYEFDPDVHILRFKVEKPPR